MEGEALPRRDHPCVFIQSEFSEVTEVSVISEAFHFSQRQCSVCVTTILLVLGMLCACTGDSPITVVRVPQLGELVWPLRLTSHPGLPASWPHLDPQLQQTLGSFLSYEYSGPIPTLDLCMCCSALIMYFPLQEPSLLPSMRAATFTSSQPLPSSKPSYARECLRRHCIMYQCHIMYMGQLPAPPSRTVSPPSCSCHYSWSQH